MTYLQHWKLNVKAPYRRKIQQVHSPIKIGHHKLQQISSLTRPEHHNYSICTPLRSQETTAIQHAHLNMNYPRNPSSAARSLTHEASEVEGDIALFLQAVHAVLDPVIEDDGQDQAHEVDQRADLTRKNGDVISSIFHRVNTKLLHFHLSTDWKLVVVIHSTMLYVTRRDCKVTNRYKAYAYSTTILFLCDA